MSRLFMIAALLGATIGLPYVLDRLSSSSKPSDIAPPPPLEAPTSPHAVTLPTGGALPNSIPALGTAVNNTAPMDGNRFYSLEHVLRFDITKEWVYQNWTRKSTGPTDVGLFAVRVPVVTGTHLGAIAGSLTYFFNAYGQAEHISFRGWTGDATQLVTFLTRTYGFQRSTSAVGEQLFHVTRGERAQSELRIRSEGVVSNTTPHRSFAVELELARPGSARFLPPRAPQLEIPQVASTPAPVPQSGEAGTTSSDGAESYLDKFRYATPEEQGQVLWRRWPN